MSEVITFPGRAAKPNRTTVDIEEEDYSCYRRRQAPYREGSFATLLYRSYDLIVQSNDADLVRDVRFDIDKAARKLEAVRRQLQRDRERLAARIQLLTTVEIKLSAAIVAALLSA